MKTQNAERLLIREYGRMAPVYDRFSVTSSKVVWGKLRSLLPDLRGLRVLDIGCGPGAHTARLAHEVRPSGSVVGVDAAQGMIDFARRRPEMKTQTNLKFERMDSRSLRFRDQSFDLAVCTFGLANSARERAVREVFRVLDSGGRFLCVSWGRANPESRAFVEALNGLRRRYPPPGVVRELARARKVIADLPENRPGSDRHPLMTQMRKTGFHDVRRRVKEISVRFPSVGAYVRYKASWGEYYRDLNRLTPVARRRFVDEVASRLRWRPGRIGHTVTWELSFTEGQRS